MIFISPLPSLSPPTPPRDVAQIVPRLIQLNPLPRCTASLQCRPHPRPTPFQLPSPRRRDVAQVAPMLVPANSPSPTAYLALAPALPPLVGSSSQLGADLSAMWVPRIGMAYPRRGVTMGCCVWRCHGTWMRPDVHYCPSCGGHPSSHCVSGGHAKPCVRRSWPEGLAPHRRAPWGVEGLPMVSRAWDWGEGMGRHPRVEKDKRVGPGLADKYRQGGNETDRRPPSMTPDWYKRECIRIVAR